MVNAADERCTCCGEALSNRASPVCGTCQVILGLSGTPEKAEALRVERDALAIWLVEAETLLTAMGEADSRYALAKATWDDKLKRYEQICALPLKAAAAVAQQAGRACVVCGDAPEAFSAKLCNSCKAADEALTADIRRRNWIERRGAA